MKKIYFDNLNGRKNLVLVIPLVFFMGIYIYSAINDRGSSLQAVSGALGFGLSVIFFGKQFFYKNYVGWNKKGVTIKLNSLWPKNFSFTDVHSYDIDENHLVIVRMEGSEVNMSLENLRVDDIDTLNCILKSNTVAKCI